jgi:hypothetical protein
MLSVYTRHYPLCSRTDIITGAATAPNGFAACWKARLSSFQRQNTQLR